MQKLRKRTNKERLDFASWLKVLVADERYKTLLNELDELISSESKNCELCREPNEWDRGHVSGLRVARQMPFDLIDTCGTDQDTPET